jgi:hypothetical protein
VTRCPIDFIRTTQNIKRPTARSWSKWFANRVWRRRFILSHGPHNQHEWAEALKPYLPLDLPAITEHAPYLSGEAIAYRRAQGRPTVDGFYTR